jgi:hypothetical protein
VRASLDASRPGRAAGVLSTGGGAAFGDRGSSGSVWSGGGGDSGAERSRAARRGSSGGGVSNSRRQLQRRQRQRRNWRRTGRRRHRRCGRTAGWPRRSLRVCCVSLRQPSLLPRRYSGAIALDRRRGRLGCPTGRSAPNRGCAPRLPRPRRRPQPSRM